MNELEKSEWKKYYWDVLKRGYTYPDTKDKEFDPTLVMRMAEELVKADESNKIADEFIAAYNGEYKK